MGALRNCHVKTASTLDTACLWLEDFDALVELLGDAIVTSVAQSKRRCKESAHPKMAAAIEGRVLAGGNCEDVVSALGISKGGSHRSRNTPPNKALLGCEWLDTSLPTAPVEWEQKRKGFAKKSAKQIHKGCVGASDGFFSPRSVQLRRSQTASHQHVARDIANHMAQIACQAACHSRLQFALFLVIAPGQANDAVMCEAASLHETTG